MALGDVLDVLADVGAHLKVRGSGLRVLIACARRSAAKPRSGELGVNDEQPGIAGQADGRNRDGRGWRGWPMKIVSARRQITVAHAIASILP